MFLDVTIKKLVYIAFIIYLSTFLVVIQPVREVNANPLVGIIARQVAKKVLQKQAENIGIAVATRSGVQLAKGQAAKTAYKAWFQRSTYAAEKMAKSVKKVGDGSQPGWVKVVLGGMAATSLVNQTREVYNSVKSVVNSLGGNVPVGEPADYSNIPIDLTNHDGEVSGIGATDFDYHTVPPESFWVCDLPQGFFQSSSPLLLYRERKHSPPNTEYLDTYIPSGKTYYFLPINTPSYIYTDKGILFIVCTIRDIVYDSSYGGATTYYSLEYTFVSNDGNIIRRTHGKQSNYYYVGDRWTVPVIYGLILSTEGSSMVGYAYAPDSLFYKTLGYNIDRHKIILDSNVGIFRLYDNLPTPDYAVTLEPLPDFTIQPEFEPVPEGDNPLVIEIPDYDYLIQENPTLTEEEIIDLINTMILENPQNIIVNNTYVLPDLSTLPDYFPPEVQEEPIEDPDEGPGYFAWLDTIIDYLRKIYESVNPASDDFMLKKAFIPEDDFLQTELQSLKDAWNVRFEWLDNIKSSINSVILTSPDDDDWEGIWIRNHPIVGDVCVVSPIPTNEYKSQFKKWIGGGTIFLTLLITVRKVSIFIQGGDN